MLRTIVCDDEAPALELIESMLRDTGEVSIEGAYLSILDAIDRINAGGIDLAVLDVEMPELTGVEASERILAYPKPLIVFATAHPEYAVEAFGIDAIDYVLKPFDRHRIAKAVEKAIRLHTLIEESEQEVQDEGEDSRADPPAMLRIRDAGRYYFIPHGDVLWIEAAGDYSLLHTREKEAAIRRTIKSLENDLPEERFVRVHRSSIVSVEHIREIRMLHKGEAQIILTDDTIVRSSRSYREVIQKLIDDL
ncbi:MAG: LytTR family DNA-binding domain-containing protein [Hyphomonas sp.]|uniref:LytR/AlgR family response regulator transcription factor n=1 Tax=Hyphomonas sp. TaxID=87 RepID=UPI003529722C